MYIAKLFIFLCLGAIQIICETFLADLRPPLLPQVTFGDIVPHPLPPSRSKVTNSRFWWKVVQKTDKKMWRDSLIDSLSHDCAICWHCRETFLPHPQKNVTVYSNGPLQFGLVTFWRKGIGEKTASKMLLKLTSVRLRNCLPQRQQQQLPLLRLQPPLPRCVLFLFHPSLHISMYTYCRNKNTCCLTLANFITDKKMPWYTYLYENRMFTNKMRCSIFERVRKG